MLPVRSEVNARRQQEGDLQQTPWTSILSRRGHWFEDLPSELLAHVASYLSKADLISIRNCSNRAIRDGVDHNFVQAWFRHRSFKFSPDGLRRLHQLAQSRFAAQLRKVEIELRREPSLSSEDLDFKERFVNAQPCRDAFPCSNMLCVVLTQAFRCTARLSQLVVCAPPQPRVPTMRSDKDFYVELVRTMMQGRGLKAHPLNHLNIENFWSPRSQFHSILTAITAADLQLDCFELCNFAQYSQTAFFAPTTSILRHMVDHSNFQTLVKLALDLDFSVQNNYRGSVEALVQLLQNNPHLKYLVLNLLPGHRFPMSQVEHGEACTPLLACLGSSPLFSLRGLWLCGLCAAGNMTLDRVVRAHKDTLDTLVLDTMIFDLPTRIPTLISRLLDTQLELLILREIDVNHRNMIQPWKPILRPWLEKDLLWTAKEDDSYKDWIEVKVEYADGDEGIHYDFRGQADGKKKMKKVLADLIVQSNCSGLDFVP